MADSRFRGQGWLVSRMKSLGYRSNEAGVCFGIAHMGLQAVLADNLDIFNQRLEVIQQTSVSDLLNISQNTELKKASKLQDVFALFEGIELFQQVYLYPHLFSHDINRDMQNAELAFSMVTSKKIEQQGGVENIAKFAGVYSANELTLYLKSLRTAYESSAVKVPFGLVLTNINHAISISFDPKKKAWILIDANQLPAQYIKDEKQFAEKVISSFSTNGIGIFTSDIYSAKKDNTDLKKVIHAWQQQASWQSIHQVTPEKMKSTDSSKGFWLYLAAYQNDLVMLRKLLEAKADPKQKYFNRTAFDVAADKGYYEIAHELLKHPEIKPHEHLSLLEIAAKVNDINKVKTILAENKILDLKQTTHGLQYAIKNSNLEMMNELIKKGVSINGMLEGDNSLLHQAAKQDDYRIIQAVYSPETINRRNKEGNTPLYIAAESGHLASIKKLLELKAEINNGILNNTPLFIAINQQNIQVVKELLMNQANPSVIRYDGSTPLSIANSQDISQMVQRAIHLSSVPCQQPSVQKKLFQLAFSAKSEYEFKELVSQFEKFDKLSNQLLAISADYHPTKKRNIDGLKQLKIAIDDAFQKFLHCRYWFDIEVLISDLMTKTNEINTHTKLAYQKESYSHFFGGKSTLSTLIENVLDSKEFKMNDSKNAPKG